MPTPFILPTYEINGWMANGDDDYGCRWVVTPGTDIADGPGVKTFITSKPFSSGSFRLDSFQDSWTKTLQGWVQCPDRNSMLSARSRFLSIFPDGSQQELTKDDGAGAKTALVELVSNPRVGIWPDATGFDWQLPIFAADPYFYGDERSASTTVPNATGSGLNWPLDWTGGGAGGLDWGSASSNGFVAITNDGDAPTWPTFTLVGPLTMPTLTNGATGEQITYNATLPTSSDKLVITTSPFARSVLLDGSTDHRSKLGFVSWFSVSAGQTVNVQLSAASGTGGLLATWRPAYH